MSPMPGLGSQEHPLQIQYPPMATNNLFQIKISLLLSRGRKTYQVVYKFLSDPQRCLAMHAFRVTRRPLPVLRFWTNSRLRANLFQSLVTDL